MMRLFIAGPMSGIPEFNFPAFYMAEYKLTKMGHKTYNPARRDTENGIDVADCTGNEALSELGMDIGETLIANFEVLRHMDGVVLLEGWKKSKGAVAEVAFADRLHLPFYRIHHEVDSYSLVQLAVDVRASSYLEGKVYE